MSNRTSSEKFIDSIERAIRESNAQSDSQGSARGREKTAKILAGLGKKVDLRGKNAIGTRKKRSKADRR
jgi:hypothetical protein